MPNWTENTWSIEGDAEALNVVRNALHDGLFDFDRLIPTPKELERSQSPLKVVATQNEADALNASWREKATKFNWPDQDLETIVAITKEERDRRIDTYGAITWYDFHNKYWGTKWPGSRLGIINDEPNRLVVHFDTAWSAPLAIAEHLMSLGLSVYGGGIYEDGSEFEMLGDDEQAFNKRFTVVEEEIAHDDYTWINRSIDWIGKPQPVAV